MIQVNPWHHIVLLGGGADGRCMTRYLFNLEMLHPSWIVSNSKKKAFLEMEVSRSCRCRGTFR